MKSKKRERFDMLTKKRSMAHFNLMRRDGRSFRFDGRTYREMCEWHNLALELDPDALRPGGRIQRRARAARKRGLPVPQFVKCQDGAFRRMSRAAVE